MNANKKISHGRVLVFKVFKFSLCLLIIGAVELKEVSAQVEATDEFSLDEFSEGLDVKESNIQTTDKKDFSSALEALENAQKLDKDNTSIVTWIDQIKNQKIAENERQLKL
jgi:hypothetical protein